MDKEAIISSLQKQMELSECDIRAEIQLVLAMGQGVSTEDFMAICNQSFKREFSKDVYLSNLKDDKRKAMLEIQLTRAGIYDHLPEGLFFQIAKNERVSSSTDDSALLYKKNKKKEEEIRKFFAPFDNGFFLQRLQLEEEEAMLLDGLRTGVLHDYFISFWGLPRSIPKMFLVPLILLLPHANKIAGNLELTGRCLSYLLKEEVQIHLQDMFLPVQNETALSSLGNNFLGLDLVCGSEFLENNPLIEIQVGPLRRSNVKDYLEKVRRAVLMDTFQKFFLPAGVDVTITIKVVEEKQDMMLEEGAEPILGYSTVLG